MNKKNNFLVQAGILASAGLIARVLGFLYRIPMQNMLGDGGTAVYGTAYNIYLFLLVLSSAGLPVAISRMVSKRIALRQYANARKVFDVAMRVALVSGTLGMVVLFFGAYTMSTAILAGNHARYSIQVLSPTVLIVAVMSVYRGYFQGLGNSVPTAISQLIEQIVNAILSVLLVYLLIENGVELAAAGGNAASGIGAAVGLLFVVFIFMINKPREQRKIEKYKEFATYESGKSIAKELIFTAAPIIAGTAVFSITNIIDTYMVVTILRSIGFTGEEAQALFGQLNGKYVVITTLPVAIASAIAVAIIPSITKSMTLGRRNETNENINMAFKAAMLICVPAAVGIGVMAYPILAFLFPSHPEGGILLQVGAFSILVLAITQVTTGILQGMNRLAIPVISAIIGSVCKIIANYFLIAIPGINVVGAVLGTTICYVIAAVINTYMVYKKTNVKLDMMGIFVKPIASAILMGLVCYVAYTVMHMAFPSNGISLIFAIGLSFFSYFVCMIYLGGITSKELLIIPGGGKVIELLHKMGVEV